MTWLLDMWRRWRRKRSRAVFRFFDGRRTRAVDPYLVYRFLDQHKDFKWEHLERTDEGEAEAADTTIRAAREAFGLAEFDGTERTLTSEETLEILVEFFEWSKAAKKKRAPGSTSSPHMDGEFSTAPVDRAETSHFSTVAS